MAWFPRSLLGTHLACASGMATRSGAEHLRVDAGGVHLEGELSCPAEARGVVLFAHGSGSGRRSPRNRFVAAGLNEGGLGTLLFDLLTEEEEQIDRVTRHLRFDIDLLAARLGGAVDWLGREERMARLPLGLFGASTGAAGALIVAARKPERVKAVVSRGGRPDLAGPALRHVKAPTLLVVGGLDGPTIEINERADQVLRCERALRVVPGASHLFEEPGTLEEVVRLARGWFEEHLLRGAYRREHFEEARGP